MALAHSALLRCKPGLTVGVSQHDSAPQTCSGPLPVASRSCSATFMMRFKASSAENGLHSSFAGQGSRLLHTRTQAELFSLGSEAGTDKWRSDIGPSKAREVERKQDHQRVQAVATSSPEAAQPVRAPANREEEDEAFACPICYGPLLRAGPKGLNRRAVARSRFRCPRCQRAFSSQSGYLDLVVTSGVKEYREPLPPGTELFRSPLVSFAYERGWRQNFARAGFPGADEEFQMARRYLAPARGGLLLDVSCGSGLFSRRFAASGEHSAVIASDFSENMLRQAGDYMREDGALATANVVLLRADVARLPFATGSVDGVHAGAALHCWPSPYLAVSEISRILKPGGVFVATTFLAPRAPFGDEFVKPIRQAIAERQSRGMKYWEAEELEELCRVCGLANYTADQRRDFIMLAATKPK